MHSRLQFSLLVLLVIGAAPITFSQVARTGYNVQVASFSSSGEAARFAAKLRALGERPSLVTVLLPLRGEWTRVVIEGFSSPKEAREEGLRLVRSGRVDQFLVTAVELASPDGSAISAPPRPLPEASPAQPRARASVPLPALSSKPLAFYPSVYSRTRAPLPDPARLAVSFVVGSDTRWATNSGLFLSGDLKEAVSRLGWIAGLQGESLIKLAYDGRVTLDWEKIMRLAGIYDSSRPDTAIILSNYIGSNEGLLLLVQLSEGLHRYRLHIGQTAPTRAGMVQVRAGINLDNNYDSRINPHRRNRKKLECELPPPGYDSLIAVNPEARWLNLRTNEIVPPAHIIFHELAEAYAKVEIGLDYLATETSAGAHELAIERERRLKSERPRATVVVTAGPNRVLGTTVEEQQLAAAGASAAAKRR